MVVRLAHCSVLAPKVRTRLPALFKVDANDCNVALLGSTPKVSEKSLGCFLWSVSVACSR